MMMKGFYLPLLVLCMTSMGPLMAADQQADPEISLDELEYKNALYERVLDPHFSDSQEVDEMTESLHRTMHIKSEPLRLAPRQPLQSTHAH